MAKIVIFGNSGSGKSTLAKSLSDLYQVAHLDLDVIAWKADQPGVREDFEVSKNRLAEFIRQNENWVIEGCYSGLLKEAAAACDELIFLNPGIEACLENCRSRPWEPHKYSSPEAQDENLQMLLNWVREYETRKDEFSLPEHRKLFDSHTGKKQELRSNAEAQKRANTS